MLCSAASIIGEERFESAGQMQRKKTECRICFSSKRSTQNMLISPCKCIGSIKYVHQQCLTEWIKIRLDQTKQATVSCQICKQNFTFETTQKSKCMSYESICKTIKQKFLSFILNIIAVFVPFSIFVFSCAYLFNILKNGFSEAQEDGKILVFIAMPLSLLALIPLLSWLFKFFLQKKISVKVVGKVENTFSFAY